MVDSRQRNSIDVHIATSIQFIWGDTPPVDKDEGASQDAAQVDARRAVTTVCVAAAEVSRAAYGRELSYEVRDCSNTCFGDLLGSVHIHRSGSDSLISRNQRSSYDG